MSKLTERAMAEAVSRLLETRTLDKITIKDITDECGLTRNTFYYHFHDIYELLRWLFEQKTDEIVKEYSREDNWEGGLKKVLDYLYEHRQMMFHIYESLSDDLLLRFINDVLMRHAQVIVAGQAKGMQVSEEAVSIAAELYVNAAVGDVMSWIRGGMTLTPEHKAQVYNVLFQGTVKQILTSAEEASRIP